MNSLDQQPFAQQSFASPEPPKKVFFKPWMFLVAGVVLAGIIIVAVVATQGSRADKRLLEQQVSDAAAVADSACANVKNKEACKESKLTQSAAEIGAVEACGMIQEPVAYDNCLWTVANEKEEANLCKLIKNPDWNERCRDGIFLNSARETKTLALCEKIVRAETKTICKNELDPLTVANCVLRGHDAAWCADFAIYQRATETYDRVLCETIKTEEFNSACGEISVQDVLSDLDGDGLTDSDERNIYKTDPAKPDTDGDGYSDGMEVKSKYNPLGPG
ncbi:MAG: hypothetical protein UY19_C0003G0002 [Candidatus Wolfebacteria bacterium GW2011_GWA2_47_9b]|uniref:Uncharacterized protein n=1 Tax=Candidatus Wolfebacteria bacterium GW2011_GWA2_47_9b TaxID=1619005 RepID=A0A0G1U8B0_9BACT|nr:MAG: hypothetical protein UY19_C0003G0002 [Candidatus Wolfebacteria bacterium GW2011_GWA2_47_9b]